MKPDVWDVVTVLGLASLAYGLHSVYPPAAFIVGGIIVMVFGVMASRGAAPVQGRTPAEG
jgi:uncharacterized membrane protein YjjB (DUF3815 family)